MTASQPLAYSLRPRSLDDFVGQEDIVGIGTALRRAIEADTLSSVILSGPPGSGKTTLAGIIANTTKAHFEQLNAVTSGVADLKRVCGEAEERLHGLFTTKTVLFVDEIHRFNKAQQDALLPFVEQGIVILVGATTENPYFEVNAALVSRSHVYLLKSHSEEQLVHILRRALEDERGLAGKVQVQEEVLRRIAKVAGGDARVALNALELALVSLEGNELTLEQAQKVLQQRNLRYDKAGDDHYDTISAFIKSLRGSDGDAALLWLWKMLQSGEHPRFLFRRMAIFASEDIGIADPDALRVVMDAWNAFEKVGLPEGEYFLAHACLYLGQCPKSDGIKRAMGSVRNALRTASSLEVPMHLRNAPVKGMAQQGNGKGYQYPHDDPDGIVSAHYFPDGMSRQNFYDPPNRGFEEGVSERLGVIRKKLEGK